MCYTIKYYRILDDDVQLELLFLTSSPTELHIRSEKFKQVHFPKTYIVLKLLLENKGEKLKINNGPDQSTIQKNSSINIFSMSYNYGYSRNSSLYHKNLTYY